MERDVQYFALEIKHIANPNITRLIEEHGLNGFGVYIMLLAELRTSPNYKCPLVNLKSLARKHKMRKKILKEVLTQFDLFDLEEVGKDTIISSPYINKVMEKYERKMKHLAKIREKGYDNSLRGKDGKFTANSGLLNKTKLNEIKTTTDVVAKSGAAAGGWEIYFEEAIADQAWMDLLAMNSGFGRLFAKHREFIIEAFRRHAILQGATNEVSSTRDVKAYFANFLRQGTPTQKRLATQLAEHEERIRQTSPHRFETIDPETGERSYFGNPIPPDAPPRPNDNAAWAESIKAWI